MKAARLFHRLCIRLFAFLIVIAAVVGVNAQQAPPPTADRANSYDNGWESQWIAHARQVLSGAVKTDGFVLQIGDSITHSRAYGLWAASPTGATNSDLATIQWAHAQTWSPSEQDVNNRNGWYLAGADTTGWRGMTALSGVSIPELFLGCCNGGGSGMPASSSTAEAQSIVANPIYVSDLQIDTVIAAFSDAQFAVVMLGTNEPANAQNLAYLTAILDKLEDQHIVPILSTIPPRAGAESDSTIAFNSAIVQLAQSRALPLIDFYQEVLLRRPGTTWFGTLISTDGIHPTGANADYTANSNPYLPGGDPASQTTGDALLNVGYLLRTWLTVQKLAEVKQKVLNGNEAPGVTLTAPASGAAYNAPATVSLAASASDSDGFISRVEFYSNGVLIGSDTSTPYEFVWNNVPAGTYAISARAVDNQDATTNSNVANVTVNQPTTIHVGDLDGSGTVVAKQSWRGTVSITVHSSAEALVPGAVVTGTWSRGASGSGSCTTSAAGSCSVTTGNINIKKSATATFSITSLTRPNYTFQADANHDVDGGTDGSVITVQAP